MNLVKKESRFWLNRPNNEFIVKSLSANVIRLMKHQMTQRPFWKNIKTGEPWNLGSRIGVPFATQWWCCTQTMFFCCAIDLWTFKQSFFGKHSRGKKLYRHDCSNIYKWAQYTVPLLHYSEPSNVFSHWCALFGVCTDMNL